jgi:murein DD-endopeptidase MepM/ murein hydrolase activator NlpD
MARGKNLLHVGTDLGWHQVNEPVFAVANGIVRLSTGPDGAGDNKKETPKRSDKNQPESPGEAEPTDSPAGEGKLEWGNLVVIEHQTQGGEYYTTLYGHLGADRLVKAGEVVEAGQPIGFIGRQHKQVNGGYKPHLHFGVREGRLVERGATLVDMIDREGKRASVKIAEIGQQETEVEVPEGAPDAFDIVTPAGKTTVTRRGEKYFVPSRLLWDFQRPDFAIVGYALSTDGWRDPIEFLKAQNADTAPAPFRPLPGKLGRRTRSQ